MTLKAMQELVRTILSGAGIATQPNPTEVLGALNLAKNIVAARYERVHPSAFLAHHDYALAVGGTSIDIGTATLTSGWRNLLGAYWVNDDGETTKIPIRERNDVTYKDSYAGFWLYREGDLLVLSDPEGADSAMTIRLYYTAKVASLTGSDSSASYTILPDDWSALIPLRAARTFMAPGSAAYLIWKGEYEEALGELQSASPLGLRTEPMCIRPYDAEDDNAV